MKKYLYAILYGIILVALAVFMSLVVVFGIKYMLGI